MKDRFIRSLQTFRNGNPASDEGKRALELFHYIERGIPKKIYDSDDQRRRDSSDFRTDSSNSLESERCCCRLFELLSRLKQSIFCFEVTGELFEGVFLKMKTAAADFESLNHCMNADLLVM